MTRVPLKQVHRIIDAYLLGGRVKNRRGSRVIVGSGLIGLRLAWLTVDTLTPTARRRIAETAIANDAATMVADDLLKVDLKPIAANVKMGMSRLRSTWRPVMKKGAVPVLLRTAPLAAIMKVTTRSERMGRVAGLEQVRWRAREASSPYLPSPTLHPDVPCRGRPA